jgi:hypothetical protein
MKKVQFGELTEALTGKSIVKMLQFQPDGALLEIERKLAGDTTVRGLAWQGKMMVSGMEGALDWTKKSMGGGWEIVVAGNTRGREMDVPVGIRGKAFVLTVRGVLTSKTDLSPERRAELKRTIKKHMTASGFNLGKYK